MRAFLRKRLLRWYWQRVFSFSGNSKMVLGKIKKIPHFWFFTNLFVTTKANKGFSNLSNLLTDIFQIGEHWIGDAGFN